MLHAAKISQSEVRNSILGYGFLSCLFYIGFLLLMKMLNLLHITELRMINYPILCLVCLYQIKRQVHKAGAYVPFLNVFLTTFFTGIFSFFLFSAFLFIYSRFDTQLSELFAERTPQSLRQLPTAVILFEGSAVSIIVGLINLQYFRRYEEGEVPVDK